MATATAMVILTAVATATATEMVMLTVAADTVVVTLMEGAARVILTAVAMATAMAMVILTVAIAAMAMVMVRDTVAMVDMLEVTPTEDVVRAIPIEMCRAPVEAVQQLPNYGQLHYFPSILLKEARGPQPGSGVGVWVGGGSPRQPGISTLGIDRDAHWAVLDASHFLGSSH